MKKFWFGNFEKSSFVDSGYKTQQQTIKLCVLYEAFV